MATRGLVDACIDAYLSPSNPGGPGGAARPSGPAGPRRRGGVDPSRASRRSRPGQQQQQQPRATSAVGKEKEEPSGTHSAQAMTQSYSSVAPSPREAGHGGA